jgi:hypothetical protein
MLFASLFGSVVLVLALVAVGAVGFYLFLRANKRKAAALDAAVDAARRQYRR